MKKTNIVLLTLGIILIHSCVTNDKFDITPITVSEPDEITENNVISISAVAGIYIQELLRENGLNPDDHMESDPFDPDVEFTFSDSKLFMEGYVISSDKSGNFFEELVVQDKLENPSYGVKILIDVNPLFISYELGRKIYVKLQGLTIGVDNGVLALGVLSGNRLEKIPSPLHNTQILRSSEIGVLVPRLIDLNRLFDKNTNQYVMISDAQFGRNDVIRNSLSYAAEPTDQFDGERTLQSCSGGKITFSTSTFSDFKALPLPTGTGMIRGILTKNFFGDDYNFVVNSPEDIDLTNPERCDPNFYECDDPINGSNTTTIFSEDFESFGNFVSEGWINTNLSGGNVDWTEGSFSGNNYAQISGFNANASNIEAWLITPEINLDNTIEETLNFDIQTSFNNGEILTIWVSSNFNGDPKSAQWQLLDVTIPRGSTSGFGRFESINSINLSCLNGRIHVGFFYQGGDSGSTRYHIDNIEVKGK